MCSQTMMARSFCSSGQNDLHLMDHLTRPRLQRPQLHESSCSSWEGYHWHSIKQGHTLQKTSVACQTILRCSRKRKPPCCNDEGQFPTITHNPSRRSFLWLSNRYS